MIYIYNVLNYVYLAGIGHQLIISTTAEVAKLRLASRMRLFEGLFVALDK